MQAPNYDLKVRQAFFDLYYNSRRPEIRALFAGTNGLDGAPIDPLVRQSKCIALSKQGYIVDPQIDTGLYDAYTINAQAVQGDYQTRPKIGEVVPFCTPPGVDAPGIPNYNSFTFAILSTVDPAEYPKNTEPDIPVIQYVGLRANPQDPYYNILNDAQNFFQIGDLHTEQKHNWTFGPLAAGVYYWTLDE